MADISTLSQHVSLPRFNGTVGWKPSDSTPVLALYLLAALCNSFALTGGRASSRSCNALFSTACRSSLVPLMSFHFFSFNRLRILRDILDYRCSSSPRSWLGNVVQQTCSSGEISILFLTFLLAAPSILACELAQLTSFYILDALA